MIRIIATILLALFVQADLPYWARKTGRTPTPTCNQYELSRTNTDISISTSFSYVDCFGISREVEVEAPEFGYRMVAYICSSVTPTLVQFPPVGGPMPPQATATLQGPCSGTPDPEKPEVEPGTPEVGCNTNFSYNGGKSYPSEYLVDLGTGTGTVTLSYNAITVPDKFTIINPKATPPTNPVILSTGYRGSNTYQSALCAFYGGKGFGCPACSAPGVPNAESCEVKGGGTGTATFTKTSGIRWVKLQVFAPLSGTGWQVSITCPE